MNKRGRQKLRPYLALLAAALLTVGSVELVSYIGLSLLAPFPASYQDRYREKAEALKDTSASGNYRPHPFFGFVPKFNPESADDFNTAFEAPYQRKEGEFVIGIFGGSVSDGFGSMVDHPETKAKIAAAVPRLKNKKIVVMNFGLGCGKQPQTFAIWTYYLESVDLSVFLDGFNEVAMNLAGYPVQYPCLYPNFFENQERRFEIERKVRFARALAAKTTKWAMSLESLGNSHFLHLLWQLAARYHDWRVAWANDKALNEKLAPDALLDENDFRRIAREGARNWAKYARLQAEIARAKGHPLVQFLQPSIHLKGAKPLSPAEKALLAQGVPPHYSLVVNSAYPGMAEELKSIRRINPHSYDLSMMFANESRDIYFDSCCHLNDQGNRAIADRLVKILAELLR